MEIFLDSFFDGVFANVDRGYLLARYKRQQLVDYFGTIITGCCNAEPDCNVQLACTKVVEGALRFHTSSKSKNGGICLLGKYHNVLYIACKLCYVWKLDNPQLISRLLEAIFNCENTLEKIFEGAIFGPKITKLITGWKSDYTTRNENMCSMKYFLEQAVEAKTTFLYSGKTVRFVDVPMNSYGQHSPLKVAVKAERWDVVSLLVRYGAIVTLPDDDDDFDKYCIFGALAQLLNEYVKRTKLCANPEIVEALFVITEAVSLVDHLSNLSNVDDNFRRKIITGLIDAGISSENYGKQPPTLRQLARTTVRCCLNDIYELPQGIYKLHIPKMLQLYLDFRQREDSSIIAQ